MDTLVIKDLKVFANHGVFEEEKRLGQVFLLTIEMQLNLKTAGTTDRLTDSIDYGAICHLVEQFVQKDTYNLVETVALKVTEGILNQYASIQLVRTTVKKPWAPIKLPLETIELTIERKRHGVYIGLGSNVGEKEENLNQAIQAINQLNGTQVESVSSYCITEPWGYKEQDTFCNAIAKITTYLEPEELLNELQEIEKSLHRVRKEKWGPRTIDLDLLFYDCEVIYEENLIVPHPYIPEREFVLQSMVELAPHWIHPVLHKSMQQLLKEVKEKA